MNLTEEQKNVIRKDNEDFDEKFNQYKEAWEKMGYGEYLSNELAWDSFIFMKENEVYKSDKDSAIISKIQKLSPHPTEAIALFFNINNSTVEKVKNSLDSLKNSFPEYKVIALPDKVSLESCSKDVLENVISMIAEIIEEL